jgi:hypothetical protein
MMVLCEANASITGSKTVSALAKDLAGAAA